MCQLLSRGAAGNRKTASQVSSNIKAAYITPATACAFGEPQAQAFGRARHNTIESIAFSW